MSRSEASETLGIRGFLAHLLTVAINRVYPISSRKFTATHRLTLRFRECRPGAISTYRLSGLEFRKSAAYFSILTTDFVSGLRISYNGDRVRNIPHSRT